MKKPFYNENERLFIKENETLFAAGAQMNLAMNNFKNTLAKGLMPTLDFIENKLSKIS